MPSAALNALVAELRAQRDTLIPLLEGLVDWSRLNPNVGIVAAIDAIRRRIGAIDDELAMTVRLEQDGYPDIPAIVDPGGLIDDLKAQIRILQLVLERLQPTSEVVSAIITPGALEPIP